MCSSITSPATFRPTGQRAGLRIERSGSKTKWSNCGVYVNVVEARWCVFRLSKYTTIMASKSQCLKIEKKEKKISRKPMIK